MAEAELLGIESALQRVLEAVTPLDSEPVDLRDADGRYLATALHAALALPPFTNSAMDGYAVLAADTPGTLQNVGESRAGRPFGSALSSGQAVAISTGAELPAGADAVVPVERVTVDGQRVSVAEAVPAHAHVRDRGSDIAEGTEILPAGIRLGPAQLG
ncbi:MAG: hypothetical protein J2O48_09810, partial [Solirubrobacterales bacterium]|nr:hypothetical protein [Solirubrobacterales bacterium]